MENTSDYCDMYSMPYKHGIVKSKSSYYVTVLPPSRSATMPPLKNFSSTFGTVLPSGNKISGYETFLPAESHYYNTSLSSTNLTYDDVLREENSTFGTPPSSANNLIYETSLPLKENLTYYATSRPSRRPSRCPSRRCPAPPPPRSDASSEEVASLKKQLRSLSVDVAFLKQALGMKAATAVQQNHVTGMPEVVNPEHAKASYLDPVACEGAISIPSHHESPSSKCFKPPVVKGTETPRSDVLKPSQKRAQFDEPIYETIQLPSNRCHSMYVAKSEPPPVPKNRSYTVKKKAIKTIPKPGPVPKERSFTVRNGIKTIPEPRPVPNLKQRSVTVRNGSKTIPEPRPVPKERSVTMRNGIKTIPEPGLFFQSRDPLL